MNETIKTLLNHRTTRNFVANQQMDAEQLALILKASRQAPTWMNGQHYSVIVITDQKIKEELFHLSPKNKHLQTASVVLVYVLDLTMQSLASEYHQKPFVINERLDVLLTATTDAALAMQNAIVASESLGYGTVCVGGIRNQGDDLIHLLKLPQYTFPLCALCIGEIDQNRPIEQVKPRMQAKIKEHQNYYHMPTIQELEHYDETMRQFAEERETVDWSVKFANYYDKNPNILTNELLKQQGF